MPVNLFEHIVRAEDPGSQDRAPFRNIPAGIIESCWILPCDSLQDSIAFNDGIPSIGFLPRTEDTVEFTCGNTTCLARGAWVSSRYLENTSMRLQDGSGDLLIVRFHPLAFYHLFGIKAAVMKQRIAWELPDLPGETGRMLHERICSVFSPGDKINILTGFLREQGLPVSCSNYVLEQAVDAIRESRGRIVLSELTRSLKVNYKWLERNFLKTLGFSPKDFSRVQRFIHAYAGLTAEKGSSLSSLAAENGYYDQSHFTKEFKRFAGKPPLAYLETVRK